MKLALPHAAALLLATSLVAATSRPPPAFIDLSRAVAQHPLHSVLDRYDREIAALRATQHALGPDEAGAQARAAGAAVARDAGAARSQVRAIASDGQARDRAQERAALSTALASPHADGVMAAYRDTLARATNASLREYGGGLAERTSRALAARAQQLREKESTFAVDLARRDAGQRLELRLKLQHLHLQRHTRARLEAQLAALLRRDAAALGAMRRADAAILQSYRGRLLRDAESDNARMAAELRSKADSNLALRLRVRQSGATFDSLAPNIAARLAAFGSSYRLGADAARIESGFQSASSVIPRRFAGPAEADRRSATEVAAQVQRLQENRRAFYRALVAAIERDARSLTRERGFREVRFGSVRPARSPDLTAALAAREARF